VPLRHYRSFKISSAAQNCLRLHLSRSGPDPVTIAAYITLGVFTISIMLSSGVLPPVLPASSVASEATVSVCFAPEEDCAAFAVRMIDGAEREILVSAYRLTVGSGVVRALIRATAGRGGSAGLDRRPGADGSRQDNGHRRGHPPRLLQLEPRRIRRISTSSPPRPSRQPMGRIGGSASPSQRLRRARGLVSGFVGRSALMRNRGIWVIKLEHSGFGIGRVRSREPVELRCRHAESGARCHSPLG
jgi:hypothetical protein